LHFPATDSFILSTDIFMHHDVCQEDILKLEGAYFHFFPLKETSLQHPGRHKVNGDLQNSKKAIW
jgi:hypothetical protein